MKQEQKDLHMLLGIIFLLCASIGMLHVKKITGNNKPNLTQKTPALNSLGTQDAFDYLTPLFVSSNVHGAARMIPQFNPELRTAIVQLVLNESNKTLNNVEKLEFLLAVVVHYDGNKKAQTALFELLALNKATLPHDQTLALATKDMYNSVLEPLLVWIEQNKKGKHKTFSYNLIKDGLSHISATNNVHALDILLSKKIPLTKKRATSLLHTVVTTNRNAEFIPLLVQKAQANVHYIDNTKHTLLMHAVLNNNTTMVHTLLQENVNANKLTNPAIGTALQLALGKRYVEIELLLRKYGAKE